METECKFEQTFDPHRNLQYVNNEVAVMHCHYYASLFTKLALSCPELNGPQNLYDAMEDTALLTLQRYYDSEDVISEAERRDIAQKYFGLAGLGMLELPTSKQGGNAKMHHAHIDEGWLKMYGRRSKPVNLIGQGYIAGAMSAIYGLEIKSYKVHETKSIVSGASNSEFTVGLY